MSQAVSRYTIRLNGEKQDVSIPPSAYAIVLRNEACKVFGKRKLSQYYLEYNGKKLDLVSMLSYYLIPNSGWLDLKKRDTTDNEKSTRVAIQYESDKSSRQYHVNTTLQKIVFDVITFNDITVPPNMQPCLVYIRTPFSGSDLEYRLIDLGWVNTSLVLRFTFVSSITKNTLPVLDKEPDCISPPPKPQSLDIPSNETVFSSYDFQSVFESNTDYRLNKIQEELFLMRRQLDDNQFATSQSLLIKIVQNIINDPDNDSKRSLNYLSNAFQTRIGSIESGIEILSQMGFELVTLDDKCKLVMKRMNYNDSLMKGVLALLQSYQIESPAPLMTNAFDPTKPIVMKPIVYPSVQENIEKQVQILQERQMKYETQIPERNVCVFRAENGFNPRNFGEFTYQNMLKHSDHETPSSTESITATYESQGDEALIREVIQRRQQQKEDSMQFKTKAKRELESLQKQRMYKRTTIRVYFPDRTVLQAYFAPRETIQDVINMVRSSLRTEFKEYPFYLFSAPPKEILKPITVLRNERMVPAAMIYLGWQNKEPGVIYTQYLIDEVLQNAPQIDQVDRGLSVNEEEEVKNQKKQKAFSKFMKAFKL